MEKEDRETLRHISKTLDEILVVLAKPPSRRDRILDTVAAVVTILGILGAIDIIKGWIGG
jgi:hypothetical protein